MDYSNLKIPDIHTPAGTVVVWVDLDAGNRLIMGKLYTAKGTYDKYLSVLDELNMVGGWPYYKFRIIRYPTIDERINAL